MRQGRKRKAGPREPSGRPQRDHGGPAEAIWQRIRAVARDPRYGTEIGRLNLRGDITDGQAAAGLRIAEVYGANDWAMGRRRTSASPSYEIGLARGGGAGGEICESPEPSRNCRCPACNAAERVRQARRAYDELIRAIPARIRPLIEAVCVDDRYGGLMWLGPLRIALDAAAKHLAGHRRPDEERKSSDWRDRHVSLSVAPLPLPNGEAEKMPNLRHIEEDAFVATLAPEMDEGEKVRKYREFRARRDRAMFCKQG
jgi:hypothetical protein